MAIIIKKELDPVYETMLLLYHGYEAEKLKNVMVSKINEMGNSGEEIYQKHLKVYDKYVRTFSRYRVTSDKDEFYFKETSEDFYFTFISLFLIDNALVDNINQMDNDQILELIFRYSEDIFEQTFPEYSNQTLIEFKKAENMIAFVNRFNLEEKEKWKMFMILQNPKDYYSAFAQLLQNNITAYEKSVDAIRPFIEKSLERFHMKFSDEAKTKKVLEDNNMMNHELQGVIPSMATAAGIVMTLRNCYFGILFDKVSEEVGLTSNGTTQYLMTCLKALSDHSKFTIITSLKICPKYATELAAELSLTPATVSHHMSTLIASKLVYVEKENGKYYYHVDDVTMKDIVEQLQKVLL
jgi:DNA-binding transcriptional ArsR family regulator